MEKPGRSHLNQVQFSHSVVSTLCNPMDCSTPGLPVHQQFLELTQTHVYRVGDAIQPSHPLLSPSPPTFNLSQHQGLFKWVSSFTLGNQSIGVSASASVLNQVIKVSIIRKKTISGSPYYDILERHITSLVFFQKMHNVNLIKRKH